MLGTQDTKMKKKIPTLRISLSCGKANAVWESSIKRTVHTQWAQKNQLFPGRLTTKNPPGRFKKLAKNPKTNKQTKPRILKNRDKPFYWLRAWSLSILPSTWRSSFKINRILRASIENPCILHTLPILVNKSFHKPIIHAVHSEP